MKRQELLLRSLYFLIATAFFHFFAVFFYLYKALWWFDICSHFLGGVAVTFFLLWLFALLLPSLHLLESRVLLFSTAFLGTFSVGILWEVFEFSFGITFPALRGYRIETAKDILIDVCAGLCVYFYIRLLKKYNVLHPSI